MPLVFSGNLVRFVDVCAIEDAMPLVEHLRRCETPQVDLSGCTYLHTALLQLLLLRRPGIAGMPRDPFLARWLSRSAKFDATDGLIFVAPKLEAMNRGEE